MMLSASRLLQCLQQHTVSNVVLNNDPHFAHAESYIGRKSTVLRHQA